MSIEIIQRKYNEIATTLGFDGVLHATHQQDGSVHIEYDGETYLMIGVKPGPIPYRYKSKNPDDILFWLVRRLTGKISRQWELRNRVPRQDTRLLLFQKHVELLTEINEEWAEKQKAIFEQILSKRPYDELTLERMAYHDELLKSGIKMPEVARLMHERYPMKKYR